MQLRHKLDAPLDRFRSVNRTPPGTIREAAKSPLGFASLGNITLSILAFGFFGTASEVVRLVVFVMLFFGVVAVVFQFGVLAAAPGRTKPLPTERKPAQKTETAQPTKPAPLGTKQRKSKQASQKKREDALAERPIEPDQPAMSRDVEIGLLNHLYDNARELLLRQKYYQVAAIRFHQMQFALDVLLTVGAVGALTTIIFSNIVAMSLILETAFLAGLRPFIDFTGKIARFKCWICPFYSNYNEGPRSVNRNTID